MNVGRLQGRVFQLISAATPPVNFRPRSRLGITDATMGRVPFWRCRNLSLIVPLYGLGEITAEN